MHTLRNAPHVPTRTKLISICAIRSHVAATRREELFDTMLGRLVRYGADAVMISTVLAGVKHASGLSPDLERISEPNVRGFIRQYLNLGDYVFNSGVAFAQSSDYFRATGSPNRVPMLGDDAPHLRQFQRAPEGRW